MEAYRKLATPITILAYQLVPKFNLSFSYVEVLGLSHE